MERTFKNVTDIELIKKIFFCDREIQKMLGIDKDSFDHYPGQIMGLGDFYCEKSILIDELLRRKQLRKEGE